MKWTKRDDSKRCTILQYQPTYSLSLFLSVCTFFFQKMHRTMYSMVIIEKPVNYVHVTNWTKNLNLSKQPTRNASLFQLTTESNINQQKTSSNWNKCHTKKGSDFLDIMISNEHMSNVVSCSILLGGLFKKGQLSRHWNLYIIWFVTGAAFF